jgi:hypothetical protein
MHGSDNNFTGCNLVDDILIKSLDNGLAMFSALPGGSIDVP